MRIVFLDSVQDFGGSQKSTINLMKNIKDEHEVLYVDFWGSDDLLINSLKSNLIDYRILNKRDKPIIIKENNNKITTLFNLLAFGYEVLKLRKQFLKVINEFKTDLVIVNNVKSLVVLSDVKAYKIVLFERTWFSRQEISYLAKKLFKKVDFFFAVSNATRMALYSRKVGEMSNIFLLPNSITITQEYKRKSSKVSKLNILNCGGYIETKGLHKTLEIGVMLKAMSINFHINIVGVLYKGEASLNYYQGLEKYIKENNLEDFVSMFVNQEDMSSFFEQADVLIHPTYSEGLPRVIMEAMAYSVPVISNPVGGVTDYVLDGYTGFLPMYNDVEDFVDKLLFLMSNLEVYNFITNNAYSLISTGYNDSLQSDKFKKILKQL